MKLNPLCILSAALGLLLPMSGVAAPEVPAMTAPEPGPSIIVVQFHGLGYGDLSCYGQTNFQTYSLDQLAAGGTRFTRYFGGNNGSKPSNAALMFGSKSAKDGITLAMRLRQKGYHTGLIGEWDLGNEPWQQGFDEFAGFLNEAEGRNYYADSVWRFAPKSIHNPTNDVMEDYVGQMMIYPNTAGKKGQFMPNLFMKAAGNFVRINKPDAFNGHRPFFLLVNLPAPQTASPGKDDFPTPTDAPYTGEPWPQAAKNRAALITQLDAAVGQLFEQLDKLKLTNDVAIFVTSAAPPEKFANTNLNFLKPHGNLRPARPDEAMPLPMIVRWPGRVPAGIISDAQWSAGDFAATALEMAGVKTGTNSAGAHPGRSVLPILLGKEPKKLPSAHSSRQERF